MTASLYLIFAGSLYALGFIGLFAITLLPLRSFLLLRHNLYLWRASAIGKAALLVVVVVAVLAISASIFPLARVFLCLTETYCGPNRAHGWFYLAFIGALYLGFEIASNLTLTVARRVARVAT